MSTSMYAIEQTNSPSPRVARRDQTANLIESIENLCRELGTGSRVPTHRELMRQFGVSERMVLCALEDLQRRRRIERRYGSGTYVTDQTAQLLNSVSHNDEVAQNSLLVIAPPDPMYFDLCVQTVHELASAGSIPMLFFPLLFSKQDSVVLASLPASKACIVYGRLFLPIAKKLQASGRRVVCVGTPEIDERTGVPMVSGNHERGGYLVAKHLIDLGHDHIAFLGDEESKLSPRWLGMKRAVEDARAKGLEVRLTITESNVLLEATPSDVARQIRAVGAPTAFMCWNDTEAAHLLELLTAAGIDVPNEVSVTGYDASPRYSLLKPALTTVEGFVEEQQRSALSLLTSEAELPYETTVIVVPRLMVGGTTGRRS